MCPSYGTFPKALTGSAIKRNLGYAAFAEEALSVLTRGQEATNDDLVRVYLLAGPSWNVYGRFVTRKTARFL